MWMKPFDAVKGAQFDVTESTTHMCNWQHISLYSINSVIPSVSCSMMYWHKVQLVLCCPESIMLILNVLYYSKAAQTGAIWTVKLEVLFLYYWSLECCMLWCMITSHAGSQQLFLWLDSFTMTCDSNRSSAKRESVHAHTLKKLILKWGILFKWGEFDFEKMPCLCFCGQS